MALCLDPSRVKLLRLVKSIDDFSCFVILSHAVPTKLSETKSTMDGEHLLVSQKLHRTNNIQTLVIIM